MTEIEKIKISVDMCNQRNVLYEEYDCLASYASTKPQSLYSYKNDYWENRAPRKFYGAISFIISYLVFYFLGLVDFFTQFAWGMFVLVPLVFIVTGLLYYFVFRNIHLRCCQSTFDEYVQTVMEFEKLMPEVIVARDEAYDRYIAHVELMRDENNCIIPEKYWDNANELLYLIKNKRAIDLVSAINKYEDIQYQERMEKMAAKSLLYTEMTAEAAEQARINSALAAKKASEAADLSRLNLYLTYCNSKD